MNFLKNLLKRINYYRTCKKAKLWNNKVSSSTYLKHPPYSNFGGKRVLNFGCGATVFPVPNVINLDCTPGDHVMVVPSGETKLPFEDNTFDLIIANHVMEHIPDWFETMKEFARTIKVGGTVEIWVPPISSDSSFGYRDHINRIGMESFAGCLSATRPGSNLLAAKEFKELGEFRNLLLSQYSPRPIVTWWTTFAPEFLLKWMVTHLRNVVSEEGFIFTKVQP